jgi:hypothetical protein
MLEFKLRGGKKVYLIVYGYIPLYMYVCYVGTFGAQLWIVLKLRHFGKQIRSAWELLKCDAGDGWRGSVGPIV